MARERIETRSVEYEQVANLLADRVRSVAQGFQLGAYITGRSGVGKTFTVRKTLENCRAQAVFLNARITPAALFDVIDEHAHAVLVIDDVPLLFGNLQAGQILMAAAGGKPGQGRVVTYNTKHQRRKVMFHGGLIAISNVDLAHDPMGHALASRLAMHHFDPTDEMLLEFLKAEAGRGLDDLAPEECLAILHHVVSIGRRSDFRLDLRFFYKAVADYRCWKAGECQSHWTTLVEASLTRVSLSALLPAPRTRAETRAREQKIARELHEKALPLDDLVRVWKERTGKSIDTFYRHRRAMRLD